jgi:hypothetical protein
VSNDRLGIVLNVLVSYIKEVDRLRAEELRWIANSDLDELTKLLATELLKRRGEL